MVKFTRFIEPDVCFLFLVVFFCILVCVCSFCPLGIDDFNMFHLSCINQILNIQTTNKMLFIVCDVFYPLNSHQFVSAPIAAIFRVIKMIHFVWLIPLECLS